MATARGRRPAGSIALAVALALVGAAGAGAAARIPPLPIPQGDDRPPSFLGSPAVARPLHRPAPPQHPFLAPNGLSNIHDDAYQSDVYWTPGPLGREPEVRSTYQQAECASLTFDSSGRIVTICVGFEGPRLVLVDPVSLDTLAAMPLPPRMPGTESVFSDFSGGGYFYLDHRDRAVVPTTTREIWVVAETESPAGPGFAPDRRYPLWPAVRPDEGVVSVLPDWDGRYWFVTTGGLVGTVDRESGEVRTVRLEGEAIGNSFAVDETGGVFIVSDHALYRFDADPSTGGPAVTWREGYNRGERQKPGQVTVGSGTTPTLLGRAFVAITDNADPRMHVLVYRRGARVEDPRLVCEEAVFAPGTGATENSLIGVGRSLVVENNYGYTGPFATEDGASTEPGLARVDFVPASGTCRTVWVSEERAPSVVPKLSLAAGLIYTYTKDPDPEGVDAWYLTAIDFRTGRTVFQRLAGTDLGHNNNYAPVSLAPDGAAFVGALGGLIRIADT